MGGVLKVCPFPLGSRAPKESTAIHNWRRSAVLFLRSMGWLELLRGPDTGALLNST